MTPARAVLAAILATVMLLAGALIVARMAGREAGDVFEILLAGPSPGLWCFLAAAGALSVGAAGVLTAFLAFIAHEDDDDGPFRRRGFPKSAPIVLIALGLALVWFALRCAPAGEAAAPIAVAVEPEPADDIEKKLAGGGPVDEAAAIAFGETGFDWTFKDPVIREGGHRWMTRKRPFTDDSGVALLCGKAWVAVTGSASEEGPADRNAERARLRALEAADAARRWLARNPECGSTIVLAVDLGQHEAGGRDDTGASTAYQRRVLIASRERLTGEALTLAAARAELAAFLADPGRRTLLLDGRRFPAEPVIVTP